MQPEQPRERIVRKGPVANAIEAFATARERGNAKATAFPSRVRGVREFKHGERTIRIRSVGTEVMANGAVALRVEVEEAPPGANPYLFVNPPVLVERDGEFVEDLPEAFRQMVGEAVRVSWRH